MIIIINATILVDIYATLFCFIDKKFAEIICYKTWDITSRAKKIKANTKIWYYDCFVGNL